MQKKPVGSGAGPVMGAGQGCGPGCTVGGGRYGTRGLSAVGVQGKPAGSGSGTVAPAGQGWMGSMAWRTYARTHPRVMVPLGVTIVSQPRVLEASPWELTYAVSAPSPQSILPMPRPP